MCTFDAPISRCEAMREMVITDQSQHQCAAEHGCPPGTRCPLKGYFTGLDFSPGGVSMVHRHRGGHRPPAKLAA